MKSREVAARLHDEVLRDAACRDCPARRTSQSGCVMPRKRSVNRAGEAVAVWGGTS